MRQRETRERVLTYAQTLMAAAGTRTLKFSAVAAAVYVAPSTLRRHFADLDALLADPNGRLTPLRGNELWQIALLELWLQRHGVTGPAA